MAEVTMKEMLEAGVHFGHQTRRWNPKMKQYIFGKRNGIYILDLQKTLKLFRQAAEFAQQLARENRRILFVGASVRRRGDRRRAVAASSTSPIAGWAARSPTS